MSTAAALASPTWRTRAAGISALLVRRPLLGRRSGGRLALEAAAAAAFSSSATASAATAAHGVLRGLCAAPLALPCFAVPPAGLRVLDSPASFYDALLRGARSARRRVSLATLYLDDGPLEAALVDELLAAQARAPERELALLVDYHRARRPGALTLPARVAAAAPGSRVALLASPAAPAPGGGGGGDGLLFGSERLPGALSEVCGVFHAKAAVFDDAVLLTGANLSADYFTSRQDRALIAEGAPELAAFVCELLEALAARGWTLEETTGGRGGGSCGGGGGGGSSGGGGGGGGGGEAKEEGAAAGAVGGRPPSVALRRPRAPTATLAEDVQGALVAARRAHPPPSAEAVAHGGCWLVPMVQAEAAGVVAEAEAVQWLLGRAMTGAAPDDEPSGGGGGGSGSGGRSGGGSDMMRVLLSSPYLNLTDEYEARLLPGRNGGGEAAEGSAEGSADCSPPEAPTLLSAAPTASGFAGASGVKGLIPHVYAELAARLVGRARARGAPLAMEHYARPGWTYHAKGLWLWPPRAAAQAAAEERAGEAPTAEAAAAAAAAEEEEPPVASVVGSSNHSVRSVRRDVEMGACVVATAPRVRALLDDEQRRLRRWGQGADGSGGGAAAAEGGRGAGARRSVLARVGATLLRGLF